MPTLRSQNGVDDVARMAHLPAAATSRPFIGPPIFKGTPEESVSEWVTCYEHVSSLNSWDDDTKVKFLYLALEGDAKKWYTTKVMTGAPNTWEEWATLLKSSFTGRHAAEITRLRLENRVQLPSESPEQYYYDVLQLCARVDPAMKEEDRVRHLLRGLRADALEKMVLANPTSSGEFLQILQRINHAALMARAHLTPLNSYLPTNVTQPWLAAVPGESITTQPSLVSAPVRDQRQDAVPTCISDAQQHRRDAASNLELKALTESIKSLADRLKAVEDEVCRPPAQWPPRTSRGGDGRPRCYYCHRLGHIARQCHRQYEDQQRQRRDEQSGNGERHFDSGNGNGQA